MASNLKTFSSFRIDSPTSQTVLRYGETLLLNWTFVGGQTYMQRYIHLRQNNRQVVLLEEAKDVKSQWGGEVKWNEWQSVGNLASGGYYVRFDFYSKLNDLSSLITTEESPQFRVIGNDNGGQDPPLVPVPRPAPGDRDGEGTGLILPTQDSNSQDPVETTSASTTAPPSNTFTNNEPTEPGPGNDGGSVPNPGGTSEAASSNSPPPGEAQPNSPSRGQKGLSNGAKIGLGVGAAVIALLIILAIIFFTRRSRNRRPAKKPTVEHIPQVGGVDAKPELDGSPVKAVILNKATPAKYYKPESDVERGYAEVSGERKSELYSSTNTIAVVSPAHTARLVSSIVSSAGSPSLNYAAPLPGENYPIPVETEQKAIVGEAPSYSTVTADAPSSADPTINANMDAIYPIPMTDGEGRPSFISTNTPVVSISFPAAGPAASQSEEEAWLEAEQQRINARRELLEREDAVQRRLLEIRMSKSQ